MNSIRSFRLHSSLVPMDVKATDDKSIPHFHIVFITLCTNIYLYDEILAKHNLIIDSTRNLHSCLVSDVKDTILSDCQLLSQLSFFCPTIRRKYALIFIFAQHRNPQGILEYRGRQAVVRQWKNPKGSRRTLPDEDWKLPVIHYSRSDPPESAISGISSLIIDQDYKMDGTSS